MATVTRPLCEEAKIRRNNMAGDNCLFDFRMHDVVRVRLDAFLYANRKNIADALDDPSLFSDPDKLHADDIVPRLRLSKAKDRRKVRAHTYAAKGTARVRCARRSASDETLPAAALAHAASECKEAHVVPEPPTKDFEYVEEQFAMKHLQCPVCMDVLVDPVQTPCDHTFCRDCLSGWLARSPLCPVDRQRVDYWTITAASRIIRGQLDDLLVRCMHYQCEGTPAMERARYETHYADVHASPE